LSLACAILPIDLGQVFNLTGSVAAFPINFIIPSYAFIKLKYYTHTYQNVGDREEDGNVLLLNPDGTLPAPKVTCRSLFQPGVFFPLVIIIISSVFAVLGLYSAIKALLPKK